MPTEIPTRPIDAALRLARVRWKHLPPSGTTSDCPYCNPAKYPCDVTVALLALAHRDAQLVAAEALLTHHRQVGSALYDRENSATQRLEAAERQLAAVRTIMEAENDLWISAAGLRGQLRKALTDPPPRVAPVDRLTKEQRETVELLREEIEAAHRLRRDNPGELNDYAVDENVIAILDQHCPRPEPTLIPHAFETREVWIDEKPRELPDQCGVVIDGANRTATDVDYCNRPRSEHRPEPEGETP